MTDLLKQFILAAVHRRLDRLRVAQLRDELSANGVDPDRLVRRIKETIERVRKEGRYRLPRSGVRLR